jgi:hypothetical protein
MFDFCSGATLSSRSCLYYDILYENHILFITYFCEMECPKQCSGICLEMGSQGNKAICKELCDFEGIFE